MQAKRKRVLKSLKKWVVGWRVERGKEEKEFGKRNVIS
jgi:hypothetical protein